MAFPYRIFYRETKLDHAEKARVLFGVGVSKRYFKKATDRNRVKRLTREAYRHRQEIMKLLVEKNHAAVDLFFIFTGRELPTLLQCELAVTAGLEKLSRAIGPKP